jgi:hypothetical protein
MADSIQTLLDTRELTASYRAAPTLAGTPMTDTFFTNVSGTTGDEVVIPVVSTVNTAAPANTRGSGPRRQSGVGMAKKQFALFHSFNEWAQDANCIRFLRSSDPGIQNLGKELLQANIDDAGRRQKLFREVVIGSIMNYGRVNIGADGAVLVPSVHATTGVITDNASTAISADYQVDDTHRGNCNSLTSGAWDTISTDIPKELADFRDAALKAGAEPPDTVYLNPLRKNKLINNTKFMEWAKYNNVRSDQVLQGNGIDNFFGWNIRFMEGYWTDSGGTQRPVIPVRNALIVPKDGPWKRCKEGTQDIPTTCDIKATFEEALASLKSVQGMFAFAQIRVTPLVEMSLLLGDNFGMGFANPNSIYMPTVFAA